MTTQEIYDQAKTNRDENDTQPRTNRGFCDGGTCKPCGVFDKAVESTLSDEDGGVTIFLCEGCAGLVEDVEGKCVFCGFEDVCGGYHVTTTDEENHAPVCGACREGIIFGEGGVTTWR